MTQEELTDGNGAISNAADVVETGGSAIAELWNVAKDLALEHGPSLLLAILVLFIGLRIIKFLEKSIAKACGKAGFEKELEGFLSNLGGWAMRIVLFIVVAGMFGVETTSFVAIVGAAGLAIGLALQGTLGNFAGGVLILIFKPFKIGDLIQSQGVTGVVKQIQIFNSILLTPENKTVIMPNGAIMNNHIVNFTKEGKIRVDLTIGIGYGANIQNAKNAILETLRKDPRVLQDPAPTVAVGELADSAVNLAVRPWCDPKDYWDVYFDSLESSKLALDKAQIAIPFPQRDVHIYNH